MVIVLWKRSFKRNFLCPPLKKVVCTIYSQWSCTPVLHAASRWQRLRGNKVSSSLYYSASSTRFISFHPYQIHKSKKMSSPRKLRLRFWKSARNARKQRVAGRQSRWSKKMQPPDIPETTSVFFIYFYVLQPLYCLLSGIFQIFCRRFIGDHLFCRGLSI